MTAKPPFQRIRVTLRTQLRVALLAGLGGCSTLPPPILPPRQPSAMDMATQGTVMPHEGPASPASAASGAAAATSTGSTARLYQTPGPPVPGKNVAVPAPAGTPVPADPSLETAIALEGLPLPLFIDTIFATVLKRNVSVDPIIAQRKELVSLKSGRPLTAEELYDAAKAVLKSYGIAVTEYNGLVRITPSAGVAGFLPEVRRGRSLPDVPAALRPVFQIVDLETVSPGSIVGWLRTIFGQRLVVQDDLGNQAVLLSGQSDDVAAAIETIRVLDQPTMRGRSSARIAPLFWSADEMAKRLGEILQAQGYSVGITAGAQAPIILLPVPPLNSVLVFARSDDVLNHILRWATELDRPASGRGSAGYFTYAVRNLDAAELAKTLQEVMNPGAATGAAGASAMRSRVVVNPSSNTLIIQGSPTEYQQWFGLLQELDRPPRTAMVSVTIAEVRLTHGEQLGFEWLLNEFKLGNLVINLSTLGAFGTTGIGGLAAVITSASNTTARAVLNALASTSRVRILANPTVMARNGEPAYIQVGSEVPVVSSQQTTGSSTALQPNVIQTIQYRNTGVILRVKPVIHAGGRIDLDVEQEVSSAQATKTGVSASPTISTRRVTTKLSVVDGATVLLGGLMTETASYADTGVPFLKDLPLAGVFFRSSDVQRDRTELVMLITPYVIADEFEARAMSDAFRNTFPWDTTAPTQSLRPPHSDAPSSLPRGAIDDAGSTLKPYILPPAGAPAVEAPSSSPGTTRGQPSSGFSTRPPDSGRPPAQPGAAGTQAATPTSPQQPAGATAPTDGTPVSDPQLLKELQNATKKK